MKKLKIPKELEPRLKELARANNFASGTAFADHLVDRGLRQYEFLRVQDPVEVKLERVAEELGYSSPDEVLEHLLERGINAYGQVEPDREKFEARLRGLGYIE